MDTTHRFRLLIYLAAFMLAMSLCFAYAKPLPSQNPLLFQVASQHSGFLPPRESEPSFDPAALHAATPLASPGTLQWIQTKSHAHHGPFHRFLPSLGRPAASIESKSSVIGLTIPPSTPSSGR
jgi:hypothetical protein